MGDTACDYCNTRQKSVFARCAMFISEIGVDESVIGKDVGIEIRSIFTSRIMNLITL